MMMMIFLLLGYGLDGLGMESQWGIDFPHPSRPFLGPTQPPVQWVLGVFIPELKRTKRGSDHPPISSAGVKERVEICPYSPLGLHGLSQD